MGWVASVASVASVDVTSLESPREGAMMAAWPHGGEAYPYTTSTTP